MAGAPVIALIYALIILSVVVIAYCVGIEVGAQNERRSPR
jgi:hypothetical protein